ncbi:PriCT-2 domain-containing protein [Pseudogemmobacter sonorensis]|uniref:PriCT-2 domain-containing protein n=1 Tax=Pseudogemmobacter sonorensis TaxID=2989681 RepID=UPI0036C84B30
MQQSGKKPLKVPHYVNGNTRGETDTPEDWAQLASYDDAKVALAQRGEEWGLAFALGPDGSGGHWQGIDLDDIESKGLGSLANRWAKDDLHDWGHVEVSPSGTGAHVIGYGRQFATLGSNASGIEAYASGRFFTVTEREVRNDSPGHLIDLADYVERELAPRHGVARTAPATAGPVEVMQVDAKTVTELRSALMHMRSDDYHLWIRMGLALRELGETGRGLWLNWSATSEKFDPKQAAKKWDTFAPTGTGYQAVFAEAQAAGWVNPASSAAQLPVAASQQQPAETPEQMLARMNVDWTGDDDAEVPDIVEGMVADEDVTLLGGHGGVGKSFLALQMACAVALGETVLGCGTRRSRVLYYSIRQRTGGSA